ncbi:MAG TPA: putative toxin-antitoxin system toxin component, PIN family [Anaerolineales bacterium]|nr:putative toxin-antitoxin system toxin component, PIN family [Anaerolineales bacterium]
MKVVIDTNILISAAWRDKTPEAVILWIASQEDWEWIVSDEILDEYRQVLQRKKFALSSEIITRWSNLIDELTVMVDPQVDVEFPRDVKDAKFLACAISASANYFITGDHDFAEAKKNR